MVPCVLRVTGRGGEGGLGDEFVGLVVEVIVNVTAQETVEEGRVGFVVVS